MQCAEFKLLPSRLHQGAVGQVRWVKRATKQANAAHSQARRVIKRWVSSASGEPGSGVCW